MEMQSRVSGVAIPIAIPPGLAEIRDRWDFAAAQGAQSHVTVLFPFLPGAALTDAVRADLAADRGRASAPFDVRLRQRPALRRGRLDRARTDRAVPPPDRRPWSTRWPDYPPYGGVLDDGHPAPDRGRSRRRRAARRDRRPGATAIVPVRRPGPSASSCWRQDDDGRWRPHWRVRRCGDQTVMSSRCSPQATRRRSLISPTVA